jgi:hypothetical protein
MHFRKEEAMGSKKRLRTGVRCGAVAAAILMTVGMARADVTTERPGSILILPKVVADGVRDTVVQITNTSNSLVHAHCYYVNGAPLDPSLPPSATNPPLWQETDFFIWLTKQQPTHWVVSAGRQLDPTDSFAGFAKGDSYESAGASIAGPGDGAGIDPGLIPAVASPFTGELVCVQVDASDAPTPGNALKGEATLVGPVNDVTKYNGIAILGNAPNSDNVLNLDGQEYNACPEELQFPHIAQGAEDPVFGAGSSVSDRLTLVPCTQNFESSTPPRVSVSVRSCDELESCLSGDFTFQCWYDSTLDQIAGNPFATLAVQGPFKYSTLTPNPVCVGGENPGNPCNPSAPNPGCGSGTCDGFVGLLGVLETTRSDGLGGKARSAQNLHATGAVPGASITLIAP